MNSSELRLMIFCDAAIARNGVGSYYGDLLENLSPVASLVNLDSLMIEDNKVNDLGPIENLDKLWTLWIQGNPIEDLSPILSIENLRILKTDTRQQSLPSYSAVREHLEKIKSDG